MWAIIIGAALLVLVEVGSADDGGGVSGSLPSSFSDRLWMVCRAIASAEGFGADSANKPTRQNNPGDLVDSAGRIATFGSADEGWQRLYHQISLMANGTSRVYSPNDTWMEIASKWTETEQVEWATNVSGYLGVPITSSLRDFLEA